MKLTNVQYISSNAKSVHHIYIYTHIDIQQLHIKNNEIYIDIQQLHIQNNEKHIN